MTDIFTENLPSLPPLMSEARKAGEQTWKKSHRNHPEIFPRKTVTGISFSKIGSIYSESQGAGRDTKAA